MTNLFETAVNIAKEHNKKVLAEKPVTLLEYIAKLKCEQGGDYPFDCGFRSACDEITKFLED
jgi:hypothetical protein